MAGLLTTARSVARVGGALLGTAVVVAVVGAVVATVAPVVATATALAALGAVAALTAGLASLGARLGLTGLDGRGSGGGRGGHGGLLDGLRLHDGGPLFAGLDDCLDRCRAGTFPAGAGRALGYRLRGDRGCCGGRGSRGGGGLGGGRGTVSSYALLLLDGRDELALAHPSGPADAQARRESLQLGQHHGGQAGARATARLGRGAGGGVAGDRRCAGDVGEEFGGVAQLKGPSQGSGVGHDQPGVPVVRPGGTDRVGLYEFLRCREAGASNRHMAVTVEIREPLGARGSPPGWLPPTRCRCPSNAHVPDYAASRRANRMWTNRR